MKELRSLLALPSFSRRDSRDKSSASAPASVPDVEEDEDEEEWGAEVKGFVALEALDVVDACT